MPLRCFKVPILRRNRICILQTNGKLKEGNIMASERKEEVRIVRDEDYESRQRVVERRPSTQHVLLSRVSQFIWLILGVIVIFLGFRFVLMLLAANPANTFASIIYGVSDVLVAPFATLLGTPTFEGGSIFDAASIVAMVVYVLAGWLVVQLLYILFGDTGGVRRVKTVKRERLN